MGKNGIRELSSPKPGFALNTYSSDIVRRIHQATFDVMQHTGIKVRSKKAADIFSSSECFVEQIQKEYLVKFPGNIIEECIQSAPSTIKLYGRDSEKDYVVGKDSPTFANGHCVVDVVDPYTGEYRPALKRDCGKIAKLCDCVPEFDVFSRPLYPNDVPGESLQLHNLEIITRNTTKHFFCDAGSAEKLDKMINMGAVVRSSLENFKNRPFFSVICAPSSPLIIDPECSDVIIQAASQGVCVNIVTMPLAGATSPATLAGTLVVINAEILSCLVLSQLVRKGAPCIYGSCSTMMNLRNGIPAFGAPEGGMIQAGAAALARFYELPSYLGPAFWTSSKTLDLQSAYEGGLLALTVALAQGSICWGAGVINNLMAIDYAKLIMDAEAAKNIQKILTGIPVDDEALALDAIHDVGPGNNFLTHEHTFSHMRELSEKGLYDWSQQVVWENKGSKTLTDRAQRKVRNILESHEPLPLSESVVETLRLYVLEYELEKGLQRFDTEI